MTKELKDQVREWMKANPVTQADRESCEGYDDEQFRRDQSRAGKARQAMGNPMADPEVAKRANDPKWGKGAFAKPKGEDSPTWKGGFDMPAYQKQWDKDNPEKRKEIYVRYRARRKAKNYALGLTAKGRPWKQKNPAGLK